MRVPKRPLDGHKGTFGNLVVIGGHISDKSVMLGSAVFVAQAAIRSGVGLVYFSAEKEVLLELIKMFPQAVGQNIDTIKNIDALVIGPGLGQSESSVSMLEKVLKRNLPTVIDADGLNILASHPTMFKLLHDKCILTPHVAEFERLTKATNIKTARELSEKLDCTIVLKSHETSVVDRQNSWINKVSNPALATGGTGDVLAGIIGGLMAQYYPKLSIFDCACLGVQIHSRAGVSWRKQHGSNGLMINELIDLIPETIQKSSYKL